MNAQTAQAIEEAQASLRRIQDFDVDMLPRTTELGQSFSFESAKEPALRLIQLYQQLPVEKLECINKSLANEIKKSADADYNRFESILKFDPNTTANAASQRDSMVDDLDNAYDGAFQRIHSAISYLATTSIDFGKLDRDARAAVQSVEDKVSALSGSLAEREEEAKEILSRIREAAAEQGVSQQASYFREEAKEHGDSADRWLLAVKWSVGILAAASIGLIFIHKIPFLTPGSTYEAIQLGLGKAFVFGTLTSVVLFATKNYSSARHNAIVNKHRQNALMTYRALVDAAGDAANRDIVLAHAAECIFSDQPSGYSKQDSSDTSASPKMSIGSLPVRPVSSSNSE